MNSKNFLKMRRRKRPNKVKTRSVYFPRNKLEEKGHYIYMLEQDLSYVVPLSGRSKNPDFKIVLTSDKKDTEELIIRALNHNSYYSSFDKVVCDFLNHSASLLSRYGDIYYEVAVETSPKDFYVKDIPNYSLINILDLFYIQINPNNKSEKLSFLYFSNKEVKHTKFPRSVMSSFAFRLLRRKLKVLGRELTPNFIFENKGYLSGEKAYFDYKMYRKMSNIKLAKITKPIGWTARGSFDTNITNTYTVTRIIDFMKVKAYIREHLLEVLNDILIDVGAKLGFTANIKIEGLLSPLEIDYLKTSYLEGKITETEINKKLFSD